MTNTEVSRLEPALGGGTYFFYPEPNPALSEALLGPRLYGIVAEWLGIVQSDYITRLQGRQHKGDPHPGFLASTTEASIAQGGYKDDRHIGTLTATADYASADEFGRGANNENAHNPYEGHHDLRGALYAHLPAI